MMLIKMKIFENIEWKKYTHNMGAENIGGKSNLIRAYEETKRDHVKQEGRQTAIDNIWKHGII